MPLLLSGISLLALSFLVHIIIWRTCLPRRQIRSLLIIFAMVPLVVILASVVSGSNSIFAARSATNAFRLLLFYGSYTLIYICIFSAVELPSPTLTIVSLIGSCKEGGCSEQKIASLLAEKNELGVRLKAMAESHLLSISEGNCVLTRKGRIVGKLFEFASVIFRLPLGG